MTSPNRGTGMALAVGRDLGPTSAQPAATPGSQKPAMKRKPALGRPAGAATHLLIKCTRMPFVLRTGPWAQGPGGRMTPDLGG